MADTTIIAITTFVHAPNVPATFTFEDGATVLQSGGLICSVHGRRRCRHNVVAHAAIVAAAENAAAPGATDEQRAVWAAREQIVIYPWRDGQPTQPPSDEELLAADQEAHEAFLDAVDAASPQETPDNDPPPETPQEGQREADEDDYQQAALLAPRPRYIHDDGSGDAYLGGLPY